MAESLFTSQTPTNTNESDGTPTITRGVTLEFAVAGTITHVRWWCPSNTGGTYTIELWDLFSDASAIGGVPLDHVVHSGTPTGDAWNLTPLTAPIAVTAAKTYRIGVNNSQGRYVASGGVMGSQIANGNITAPGSGGLTKAGFNTSQGSFNISSSIALPTNSFNSSNYFVDVVFQASGSTTPFTRDYTLNWRVFNAFTKDVTLNWRVLNAFTKDTTLNWRVLAAFTRDYTLNWRVLNALTRDYSLAWRIFNGFTADTAIAWRVFGAFTRDYTISWDVLSGTSFQRDYTLSWRVFNSFSRDYSLAWRVFATFTRDYAVTWRVFGAFTRDHTLVWRVYGGISRDYTLVWAVLGDTPGGGLVVAVWSGTMEVPVVSIAVWDGTTEHPAIVSEVV